MLTIHTAAADFMVRFTFAPKLRGYLGVERECFIIDERGAIVPRAPEVLAQAQKSLWIDGEIPWFGGWHYGDPGNHIGFELSACQIETRTDPSKPSDLQWNLERNQISLDQCLAKLGLRSSYKDVAPADMPLDVFPDPAGRYQKIVAAMSHEVLVAACRIIGTHVHYGVPDHDTALRIYNHATKHCRRLMRLGDKSNGERLAIYSVVKPDNMPPTYASWFDFYDDASTNGFVNDPRSNWRLIRITKHGTIEFRMFGGTDSVDTVHDWAMECKKICDEAL